ncbi:winged helix-turn-helix domain-containing protein [Noviherbaspirillum suwonense]|uniref:winged helix-turn-helix domain-containing protein n=1 Tax=Noviherbaspirillum suwonense TaxID=1224511 RepID=UPI003D299A8A
MSFEVGVRAVSKWKKVSREGGLRALRSRKQGRRHGGRLYARQAANIQALIIGKAPNQLRLPNCLLARESVANLMAREYGVAIPPTVWRYLKAWSMSAQKPVRWA